MCNIQITRKKILSISSLNASWTFPMEKTHCFVQVAKCIQMVFLVVRYFAPSIQVSWHPWTSKESLVQSHTSVNGSWLTDQKSFHGLWSAPTSSSFFTLCTISRNFRYPQRLSCQQKPKSFSDNKRFSYHVVPYNICIQNYELFSTYIFYSPLHWLGAITITYVGHMPRFISWYSPVINVLILQEGFG